MRAQLEKDNGITRLRGGMRREKTMDLLLANASMSDGQASEAQA